MVQRNNWFDDMQKNLSDLIARSPAADIERNVKGFLGQTFTRLDLVTRDEFDVQRCVLLRTREKVEALEARIAQLEQSLQAPRH